MHVLNRGLWHHWADEWLRWGWLEASLLSWWPGLVALDLVQTIQLFVQGRQTSVICQSLQTAPTDAAQDQWIECSDFGGLRMVAEGLQNKDQIRKRVGVNRPNTLR